MTSVQHTNGDFISGTSMPTSTGDWTVGLWLKCSNYAGGGPGGHSALFSWGDSSANVGLTVVTGGFFGSANQLLAVAFSDGAAESHIILTDSDSDWLFCAFRHANGSADSTFSWCKELGSLSHVTFTSRGAPSAGSIIIGSDQFGANAVNCSSRSFFARNSRLSDAELLTASQSLNPPSGSNLVVLDLDSPTDAGDNLGTGNDYTITGTLQTDSTEPSLITNFFIPFTNIINFSFNF